MMNDKRLLAMAMDRTKVIATISELNQRESLPLILDCSNDTLLHRACRGNNVELVAFLLSNKSRFDVNRSNKNGKSALHEAALIGSLPIVELLLHHGAHSSATKHNAWTPLMCACEKGHAQVAEILIGDSLEVANKEGSTCLYIASRAGNFECVKILVANGAIIRTTNNNLRSPVHAAAMNGHLEILKFLFESGADVYCEDSVGHTVWHEAAGNGHVNVLTYLGTLDSDGYTADNCGRYPLHVASKEGHEAVVQFFITKHVDVNVCDHEGLTCGHICSAKGHANALARLIQAGMKDIRCKQGRSAMDYAEGWNRVECIKLLQHCSFI